VLRPLRVLLVLGIAPIILLGVGASPVAADCSWVVVESPNPAPGGVNALLGASGTSAADVWAVGQARPPGGDDATVAEHWDGTAWSVSPTPSLPRPVLLTDVLALAPSNVWAVGDQYGTSPERNLIEHWNGSDWRVVATPSPGRGPLTLSAIDGISGTDIWAVGSALRGAFGNQPMILHGDGVTWSVSRSPAIASGALLTSVAVISPQDAWAVGYASAASGTATLIEHWNGRSWRVVESPNQPGFDNVLFGASAAGADDVWAVGSYGTVDAAATLIEHWDGSGWTIVASPSGAPMEFTRSSLADVQAASTNDVVAVGTFVNGALESLIIEHWDGVAWSKDPGNGADGALFGVARIPGTKQTWAVGRTMPVGQTSDTLTERRC
jgi:hypothetical protein